MFNEYLFHLCDCTCSNVMYVCSLAWWSNQIFFFFLSILFVSGSDFCHFGVESFYQNVKIFVLKKCVWPFCDCVREWFHITIFLRNFNFSKILGREFRESLASGLQLRLDSQKSAYAFAHFVSSLTINSRVTNSWNVEKDSYKGLKISVFKITCLFALWDSHP